MLESPPWTQLVLLVTAGFGLAVATWACGDAEPPPWNELRAAMIREIDADVRLTRGQTGIAALDERVVRALGTVPRHELVPERWRAHAYDNRPLPIGRGQTISQPFVVALMTHLLEPAEDHVVLDVGTGSGYQAAVLAELVDRVVSIEIVPELGRAAAANLARLGYDNVEVHIGDGFYGLEEHAPFDSIVVAAAVEEVPASLIDQLKPGGRLVLPRGDPRQHQELTVLEKAADGSVRERRILGVRFVPLTGDRGGGP